MTCNSDSNHTLIREILSVLESPQVLLIYAADGTASQGEDNGLEHWYATAAVAYHQGTEVRHSERLIGTQKVGNLMPA
jgi:hypothetical protein